MFGIIVILALCVFLAIFFPTDPKTEAEPAKNSKYQVQMKKLWSIAQTSMRERKPVRAEKALLTILKFDEKNAAAYNRLGILYAKSQKYDEAIECFEIAQSLDSNPSSLHNAGLIYLETGAFEQAKIAFEQALKIEGDMPARFLALSKAEEKLGNRKAAIEALESAYELDRNVSTLRQMLAIYEAADDQEAMAATTARIEAQLAAKAKTSTAKTSAKTPRKPALVKRAKPIAKPIAKLPTKPATKPAKALPAKRRRI